MVVEKDYKGATEELHISGSINSAVPTFTVKTTPSASWPTGSSLPFAVTIDRGQATEETCLVTARSGSNFSGVTRGYAGTPQVGHSDDASVEHTVDAVALADMIHAAAMTTGKVTTPGDMLIADAAGSFARTPKGANGQLLTVTSGVVGWTALPDLAITATTQFGANVVPTSALVNDAVTYPKMQNVSVTDRVLGRDTAGAGDVEELTVGGGVEFTGTGGLQRSALTGDVTATAGSGATTIANDAVTTAKILDSNVTTAKINNLAVTAPKMADATITQGKVASGLALHNIATSAPTGVAGQTWYDTTNNLLYVYNGSAWVCITPISAVVLTQQSTGSTTYVNLGTTGPVVSIQTGTKALVWLGANLTNSTATQGAAMAVGVTGASTNAADDTQSAFLNSAAAGQNFSYGSPPLYFTGLTAGVNVFTAKYRAVGSGTAVISNRTMTVVGIP